MMSEYCYDDGEERWSASADKKLATFRKKVDTLLADGYGLTLADLRLGDDDLKQAIESGETPTELVGWLAQKYNLTHCSELEL